MPVMKEQCIWQHVKERYLYRVATALAMVMVSTLLACHFTPPSSCPEPNTPEGIHCLLDSAGRLTDLTEGDRVTHLEVPGLQRRPSPRRPQPRAATGSGAKNSV